jgi:hypothetical protein
MKIYRIANDFEKWFEGSKAVDQNNNPIPVFHGTNQIIKEFDTKYLGENTFNKSALEGFFFTEDRDEAKTYADLASSKQVKNKEQYENKIKSFERLHRLYERRGEWDKANEVLKEWEEYDQKMIEDKSGKKIYHLFLSIKNPMIIDATNFKNIGDILKGVQLAKSKGHDGVLLKNIKDGYHYNTNHWVAFNKNQIRIQNVEEID